MKKIILTISICQILFSCTNIKYVIRGNWNYYNSYETKISIDEVKNIIIDENKTYTTEFFKRCGKYVSDFNDYSITGFYKLSINDSILTINTKESNESFKIIYIDEKRLILNNTKTKLNLVYFK